jgi:hypothetical protein
MKLATILALLALFAGASHARVLKNTPEHIYKQCVTDCFDTDGWHPICVYNPAYQGDVTITAVSPNFCMTQCMVEYTQVVYPGDPELSRFDKITDLDLPKICKIDMWKIYNLDGRYESDYNQTIVDECTPDCILPIPSPPSPPPSKQENEREREVCYNECFETDDWNPICGYNPAYPTPVSHADGSSVWPNFCMMKCMEDYYWNYPEWSHLEKIADLDLPEICKTDMWKIYYLDDRHDYNYNQTIIDKCNPVCAIPSFTTPAPAPAPTLA